MNSVRKVSQMYINNKNYDEMILADGVTSSFNSLETGLNNNVMVLGATGSGKSMSITEPQMIHTFNNSLVVPVTKRKVADEYAEHFHEKGYMTFTIDMVNPEDSMIGFDPFDYIQCQSDILTIAKQIVFTSLDKHSVRDPYWDTAAVSLVSALISALIESYVNAEESGLKNSPVPNAESLIKLCNQLEFYESERSGFTTSSLDNLFARLEKENSYSYAAQCWGSVKGLASKTVSCIISTMKVTMSQLFTPRIRVLAKKPYLDLTVLGKEKAVLFIITSPVDKSTQMYTNIIYSTLFKELFEMAEKCEGYRLPVPVHFICDDFACGSTIPNFADYISVIRSAGISVTLLVQSLSQLESLYGKAEAVTIMNNCDRMVYLGGTDIGTCSNIAMRANVPFTDILNMPLAKAYVFERGKAGVIAGRYRTMENPVWIGIHRKEAAYIKE